MRACEDVCVCLKWYRGFSQSESGNVGSEIFFSKIRGKVREFCLMSRTPVFKNVEQSFDFFPFTLIHSSCLFSLVYS